MDINLNSINNEYFSNKLDKYLNQVSQTKRDVVGIILFGSLARGDAVLSEEKKSDIDLIIIFKNKEIPEHPRNRNKLKFELMRSAPAGVDSIWVTEDEFRNLVQIKADIILYALDEGKVLYDPKKLIQKQKDELFQDLEKKGVKKEKHYWTWPIKYFGEEIEW